MRIDKQCGCFASQFGTVFFVRPIETLNFSVVKRVGSEWIILGKKYKVCRCCIWVSISAATGWIVKLEEFEEMHLAECELS